MKVFNVEIKYRKAADKCNAERNTTWDVDIHTKTPLVAKALGVEQFRKSAEYKNCLKENSVRVKFVREY